MEEEERYFDEWTSSLFPTLTNTLDEEFAGLKTVVFDYSKTPFINSPQSNFILKIPDAILFKFGLDISEIIRNNKRAYAILSRQNELNPPIKLINLSSVEGESICRALDVRLDSIELTAIQKVLNMHPIYEREFPDECAVKLAIKNNAFSVSSYYQNIKKPDLVERIKSLQLEALTQTASIAYLKKFVVGLSGGTDTHPSLVECVEIINDRLNERESAYKKVLGRSVDLKQQKQEVLKREKLLKVKMDEKVKTLNHQIDKLTSINFGLDSSSSNELKRVSSQLRKNKKILENFIINQCAFARKNREESSRFGRSKKKTKFTADVIETLRAKNLLDEDFYTKAYPDVAISKFQPHEHFYLFGFFELRNPSKNFNTLDYIVENPEILLKMSHPYDKYLNKDG